MKKNRNIPSRGTNLYEVQRGSEFSSRLPSDYSPPTLNVEGSNEEYFGTMSFDVQMTVRSKVNLTRKQLCMLSGLALSDVTDYGLNINDWMLLEYLYSSLLGNKQKPEERKDPKEFELLLLLKVVLLSGTWMGLSGKVQLPEDVQELISRSKLVPKGRTKASWRRNWDFKKFLEIRAVPLESLLDRSRNTERYSSYTKGYGESSRTGRRKKTRPSSELDGETVDLEKDEMVNFKLQDIELFLTAVLLELTYSQRN